MINNITIVGGGSAGWMTATTLLNQFPDKKITLVESPNISNIGVGESTVPNINNWFKLVDINTEDFMSKTDAVHKLSIAYEGWYRKDSKRFHYAFGPPRTEYPDSDQNIPFKLNDWHLKKIFYPDTPVTDYAECFFTNMALINQNKSRFIPGVEDFLPTMRNDEINHEVYLYSLHAYQLDADKFGTWLRDTCCITNENFTHILGEVEKASLDDNGIKYLILDDGQRLKADLFIDCTGFKSLLLKEFDVPFISAEDYIPNNYSWATKIPYEDPEKQIVNYTNCTAINNGWIWEIPLWSRMGSGYVFSDKFISTEEALKEFKKELTKKGYKNVEDLEYRLIPMRCGIQSKLWVKNTCAIGLSAAFIEPLQSNGLQLVHSFLYNLCRTLSRDYVNEWDRREFTTKCLDDFYGLAPVVAFSYTLSHRDDTEYWRHIQNKEWPEKLFQQADDGFLNHIHAQYVAKNHEMQFNPLWGINQISIGMNWNPIDKHSIKYNSPLLHNIGSMERIKQAIDVKIKQIEKRKKRWDVQVENHPSPYQYLKENVHNTE